MTKEIALVMLKAKLECLTRDTSGTDKECNSHLCGECPLNYDQGNMGEQKECLRFVIELVEKSEV